MKKDNNQIRCIALALIKNGNKYLVFKAKDDIKNNEFYRPLGGGIELNETSDQTLKREFREEIGAELINLKLMKVIENIFDYQGRKMHEIAFLYEAEFKDKSYYKKNGMSIIDSVKGRMAVWVEAEILKGANFYPDSIKDLI